jgi:hypothetical protein
MADIQDITSSELERRNFIKKAAVAAWSAPVVMTVLANSAKAGKPGSGASCVKQGGPCVPEGVPCCKNTCRPVDHGRFQCVGPK